MKKDGSSPKQAASDSKAEKQQLEELTNDLKRIQAEFINYKKRSDAERSAASDYGKSQAIKELLPVIDDLERALVHQPDDLKGNKWAEGVAKVYDRLQNQLTKLNVKKIDALNQPFNPLLHEAVQVEGEGDNQIVSEVLQNGYMLHDQIIRHAIVKVINQ